MITLGINAAYHDSAACVVVDGALVGAAEEERFTQIKHGKRPVPFSAWELPYHAIDYCLAAAGATLADVDHVAYSYEPGLFHGDTLPERIALPLTPSAHAHDGAPWDPLFLSYIVNAPRQLAGGAPHHLGTRLRGDAAPHYQWHFVEHHLAHQASAFLAAPFDDCAVLTLDGRGEAASTQYGVFRHGRYRRLGEVRLPHSLGLLYEDVTRHLGFLHSSDEYKVMALASFGSPRLVDAVRERVRWRGDGQYEILPMPFAQWCPARPRGAPFTAEHADLAYAVQKVLEETALTIARWLRSAADVPYLAMAGGVALNCVMNARLRDARIFDEVWVQPAAGDAGTALGAALWIDREARSAGQGGRPASRRFVMEHVYYGPGFDEQEIEAALRRAKLPYERPANYADAIAQRLADERVIGWFQGRMEFGPRALGARSILASPRSADMQNRLNELKDREDFRPVAPAVLEERAPEWFASCKRSPFMLFVHDVHPHRRASIPAATHADGSARVQTVSRATNPVYYDTIAAFERRTGVPVVINTSFNTRGKPIVCTPRDALECFFTSPIDTLAIGPFVLDKAVP
ncbi:MAG TPA: carbamoyltransferase C-terminal domain-containing protein [Casimicrobiaceae bacterium]|nr:carbamoyltransferase C-terminal domain-containing protein [Casimicrobiaceae bacterium]